MADQWIGKCSHCAWVMSGETFGRVSALRHLVTIARHPAQRLRRPPRRSSPATTLRSHLRSR